MDITNGGIYSTTMEGQYSTNLWGCNCLYSGIENQQSNISGVVHMGVLSNIAGYC